MLKKSVFVLFSIVITSIGNLVAQEVLFEADFDGSSAVSGSVSANATAANLNLGTATGVWTLAGSAPGAVISDGGSNNCFLFDRVTSGNQTDNSADVNFTRSLDLTSENLIVEMDLYAVRQSNGQRIHLQLQDGAGNTAYEFVFRLNNTKDFYTIDHTGTIQNILPNPTSLNNGFLNPTVNGFLSWGSGASARVRVEILNQITLKTGKTGKISIDWNGDGDFDDADDISEVSFTPRNEGISEISSLRIANDGNLSGGARIDNIEISSALGSFTPSERLHNLARNQVTRASPSLGDWPSQFATDGFVTEDSRWRSNGAGPHWLELEMAVPMTIGSAHIYSGGTSNDILNNYELQYFDGSSWLPISGATGTGNTLTELNLLFTSPIFAQRFRIYSTDATVNIKEIALFAPTSDSSLVPISTGVDFNVAKLRQYEFSSVSGTGYPKLAFDGYRHTTSAWRSENSAGPHYIEIIFPRSESIGSIHLYTGVEGVAGTQMQDIQLSYLSAGSWVPFPDGSITGNTEHDLNVDFNSNIVTNGIRLLTNDNKQAIVREIVALARRGGPSYPLGTDASEQAPFEDDFLEYGDHFYTIENVAAGLNLTTSKTSSTLTTEVPHYQILLNLDTGTYRLRSRETEACFEVGQASIAAGADIVEGAYSSMPHQRWQLIPLGDTAQFHILNLWSGMALSWDGSKVIQVPRAADPAQYWSINYETHFPKQGQASHFHFANMFKPSWAYRWTFAEENTLPHGQYYPMQWGHMNAIAPGILEFQNEWYRRANQTTVMGFNEPDLHEQSNIEEDVASYYWPRLERMRLPLQGPGPANRQGIWRQTYEAIAEERGYRCEYMDIHWYSTGGASSGSPSTFINNLQAVYNNADFGGKPIWITEFSTRDFVGDKTTWSRNHNFNFLAEFAWRAESLPWLGKWSVFEWSLIGGNPATTDASFPGGTSAAAARAGDPGAMDSPRLALHYSNDSQDPGFEDLSECGLILAGWDGKDYLETNTAYIIHNEGSFLRLIDDPDNATVTTKDVRNMVQTEQFILESAPNNRYYIIGLSDGRRLSFDGSSVGLAPKGVTTSDVEWELNESEHGWYFLDHPATNRRLRNLGEDNFDTVGTGTSNNFVRFRFIKHYNPITLTEVQTLPYFEGFENGVGAWRQFEDDDYDWELGTGGTPTAAAGPNGASVGDNYLFAEGHDTFIEDAVTQVEAYFDFSNVVNPELRFHYHMNGFYIDFLAVDIHDGTTWHQDVWRLDGRQQTSPQDPWLIAIVDLTSYAGNPKVTVRFRTGTTEFNAADPAIDNISIQEASDPEPDPPFVPESILAIGLNFATASGAGSSLTLDPTTLAGAPGVAQINWNNTTLLSGTSGNTNQIASPIADTLVDSEGNVTTTQVSFTMANMWSSSNSDTAYGALMSGYLDTSANNNATVTFTQIPYSEYDVVVYLGANGSNRSAEISDGETSYFVNANSLETVTESTYTQGLSSSISSFPSANYVVFSGKTDSSFAVTYIRGSSNGGIHGIQIVPTGPVLTPFEAWAQTAFSNAPGGTDISETGNPDGDPYDNFAEYLFGTNPMQSDSPILSLAPSTTEANTMELQFTRRVVDGFTIYPEWSPDLQNPWFTTGFTEIVDPNTLAVPLGEVETVTVSFLMDLPSKFVRVRAESD